MEGLLQEEWKTKNRAPLNNRRPIKIGTNETTQFVEEDDPQNQLSLCDSAILLLFCLFFAFFFPFVYVFFFFLQKRTTVYCRAVRISHVMHVMLHTLALQP